MFVFCLTNNKNQQENEENESTLIEPTLNETQIEVEESKPKIKFIKNKNAAVNIKNNKNLNGVKKRLRIAQNKDESSISTTTFSCKEQQRLNKKKENYSNKDYHSDFFDFEDLKKRKSKSMIETSHLESTRCDYQSSNENTLVNYENYSRSSSTSTLTPSRSSSSASLSQSIHNTYHRQNYNSHHSNIKDIFRLGISDKPPTKTKSCYFLQDIKKSDTTNHYNNNKHYNTNFKRSELQNSTSYNCLIEGI